MKNKKAPAAAKVAAPASGSDSVGAWGDKPAQLKAIGLTPKLATKVIAMLNRTGGWRQRSDIKEAIENVRLSCGAAHAYYAAKNWEMMLLELSDAAFALEEIKASLGRSDQNIE